MEATEELIEMTGDKDDETTRLAIAKEDACPWLGKILGTYIELKYGAERHVGAGVGERRGPERSVATPSGAELIATIDDGLFLDAAGQRRKS